MLTVSIYATQTRWRVLNRRVLMPLLDRTLRLTRHSNVSGFISVVLTGDAVLRRINRETRGKDVTTDVLSFPLTKTPSVIEGEILISVPRARRQAVDIGQSLRDEIQFLFVHGCLHILGFDHERSVSDERRMNELQRRILKRKK